MRNTRFLLLLSVAALCLPAPALAQSVGVTAAVNQSALGTQPGSAVRTITLGANVIYNERIETSDVGLVQILLADGTTFTVGPNSALVIDSFVYDPAAGTAQVAATLTRGVLRFIGGATSKTTDGVAITTPVGTVGIRGAVTDINLDPSGDIPPHISLIFGSEVTLEQGQALLGRLFQAGYSLAFGAGGDIEVVKTPPGWTSEMQAALSGQPGTSGGAPSGPTSQQVAESGITDENSGQSPGQNDPESTGLPLNEEEIEQLLAAAAAYEEVRQYIVENPPPDNEPEEPEPVITQYRGFSAGVVHFSGTYVDPISGETFTAGYFPGWVTHDISDDGIDIHFTTVGIDENGIPRGGFIDVAAVCNDNGDDCGFMFDVERGAGGTVEIFHESDGSITPGPTYPAEGTIEATSERTAQLPSDVDYCTCDFLKWGFWDASVTDPESSDTMSVTNGVWVAARPEHFTTAGQLSDLENMDIAADTGMSASYSGHAVGTLVEGGVASVAAGNMNMNWDFGSRVGEMEVSGFGGHDFTGDLHMNAGGSAFVGGLYGDDYAAGTATGAFVNDGNAVAGGVMGDFALGSDDWSGTGVFMGERGPDNTFNLPYSD